MKTYKCENCGSLIIIESEVTNRTSCPKCSCLSWIELIDVGYDPGFYNQQANIFHPTISC